MPGDPSSPGQKQTHNAQQVANRPALKYGTMGTEGGLPHNLRLWTYSPLPCTPGCPHCSWPGGVGGGRGTALTGLCFSLSASLSLSWDFTMRQAPGNWKRTSASCSPPIHGPKPRASNSRPSTSSLLGCPLPEAWLGKGSLPRPQGLRSFMCSLMGCPCLMFIYRLSLILLPFCLALLF